MSGLRPFAQRHSIPVLSPIMEKASKSNAAIIHIIHF